MTKEMETAVRGDNPDDGEVRPFGGKVLECHTSGLNGKPKTRARRFTITVFPNQYAASKSEETVTLRSLERAIKKVLAGEKANLPYCKLGTFGDDTAASPSGKCYRSDANLLTITGVEGDYDGGVMSPQEAHDLLSSAGVEALICTTASHTDTRPRWRVLAPTSRSFPPSEREKLLSRVNGILRPVEIHREFITAAHA